MARNVDIREQKKFDSLSEHWWDPDGPLGSLHHINAARTGWIRRIAGDLRGLKVLDVGCGGGILSEALARQGACVQGIDMSEAALSVASNHALREGLSIQYTHATAEDWAFSHANEYDLVVCMELLEHVPDPAMVIDACSKLVKPGGRVLFSTVNRTMRAFLLVIVAAEYCLRLLARNTHDYNRFIKPSELEAMCRQSGLSVTDLTGLRYLPFPAPSASETQDVNVNYLLAAIRPADV